MVNDNYQEKYEELQRLVDDLLTNIHYQPEKLPGLINIMVDRHLTRYPESWRERTKEKVKSILGRITTR
jgi:hypothetical protein